MGFCSLAALWLVLSLAFSSCFQQPSVAGQVTTETDDTSETPEEIVVAKRQWVYLPAYSQLPSTDPKRRHDLAVSVIVRNTDLENPIFVRTLSYYNGLGELTSDLLETPHRVEPMATAVFPIDNLDRKGGIGASFLVEWVAETVVNEPVIEALMLSADGKTGFGMSSSGRVLNSIP